MDDSLSLLFNGLAVMALGYLLIYGISRLEALHGLEKLPCKPHEWVEDYEKGSLYCKKCFIHSPRSQPVRFKDKKED